MPNDVILFIGAGFSKSAGVPLMSEFVILFEERLKQKGDNYHKYLLIIKKYMIEITKDNQIDLEVLMDILYRLADGDTVDMAAWKEQNEITAFGPEIRKNTKIELENLIREKCIINPDIKLDNYFPLNDIFKAIKPLDIFSVNYDDVLEVFCYKNKYNIEDGFALYWDATKFDNLENIDVKLLKLHGSVLWYRTQEGAFYKVLLKVPQEYNKLITGEQLEQLLAYPVAGKPIHVAPLAYAMNELRKRLEVASQCIIIGYSMRDKHIIDIFIEALRRNDELKLILVNPDPFEILKNLKHEALLRSIIPVAFKTEEILHANKLLRISGLVKAISKRPFFEAIKNPFKAAQEYFEVLDYENAMKLIKEPSFWQSYSDHTLRNVEFLNILSGLTYTHMVGKFTLNPKLEKEAFDLIEETLRKTARLIKEPQQDAQIFFERSIQANKWVQDNLQGVFKEKVETITKMRINVSGHAITELKKTNILSEQMKIIERFATILFKWTTDPIIPYDDDDYSWIFIDE